MRNLVNLRSAPVTPASVGGYTEAQCGDWLQGAGADTAACGCKQTLKEIEESSDYYGDYGEPDNDSLGLRSATLDLRKKRKVGE